MRSLLLLSLLTLTACDPLPGVGGGQMGPTAFQAQGTRAFAQVVAPGQVPAAVVGPARAQAQAAADKASERRDIDYFALPAAPIGMKLGDAWVLSFLGTGKTDPDLNVELRAFVGGDEAGFTMNYSGPTTLGRKPLNGQEQWKHGSDVRFELLTGLPGEGVAEAYADYMDALAPYLQRRHGARPFAFDDVPLVFALHQGGKVAGFVFTNQGNRLVLGERKYADVQSVVAIGLDRRVAAAYTLIAYNRKTEGPGGEPTWTLEDEERFGTLAWCGEGPR